MSSPDHGWAWFDEADADLSAGSGPESADPELARAFARCFRGEDGARVIGHLGSITLGRVLGPKASDAHLRHLEGQRQLIAYVKTLIERGRMAG